MKPPKPISYRERERHTHTKCLSIFTLSVIDGSPEKSSLVIEIAKLVAGRNRLAKRKTSSSLTWNSLFVSSFFLKDNTLMDQIKQLAYREGQTKLQRSHISTFDKKCLTRTSRKVTQVQDWKPPRKRFKTNFMSFSDMIEARNTS